MTDVTTSSDQRLLSVWGARVIAHRRAWLTAVVIVAIVARAAMTIVTVRAEPELTGDQKSYNAFATAIVSGDWFGKPVSYREPGYPLLVAAVYAVTGGNQTAARMFNALLGGLTCLALYGLGRRVFGAGVGLMAAAWYAVYFHSVAHSAYLLRETLVTLLATVLWITLWETMRGARRTRWAILSALVYLALVHTDARFLFHAPLILVLLLVGSGGWRRGLTAAVILFAVFLVGMLPWQIRNYMVYDRIVVVNTRTLVVEAPWRDYTGTEPVAGLEEQPPDTRTGVRRLTGARKALYDLTEFYRAFRFRGEVRNNSNVWERAWSPMHNWTSILGYGILIPFFLLGYWLILTRRMTGAYVLVAPVVAHTILHVLKWGRYRYRIPIEPLLILVAFFAIAWLWSRLGRRRRGVAA
jgi:4-amino-4-deoxy-L-arabinose transferase-like glycosyltransferase